MADYLPDFSDPSALEAWLMHEPREFTVLFAARAGLRALPLTASGGTHAPSDRRIETFLPSARAAATALASSTLYQGREMKRASARAADAAMRASDAAQRAEVTTTAVRAIAATACAALAGAATRAEEAAGHAVSAAANLAISTDDTRAVHAAFRADAVRFRAEGAYALANSPLWPSTSPETILSVWRALERQLGASDAGWEVWIQWYGARLRGEPVDWGAEDAKALLAEADWSRGAEVANAEIVRQVEGRPKIKSVAAFEELALRFAAAASRLHGSAGGKTLSPEQRTELSKLCDQIRTSLRELGERAFQNKATFGGLGHNQHRIELSQDELEDIRSDLEFYEHALDRSEPKKLVDLLTQLSRWIAQLIRRTLGSLTYAAMFVAGTAVSPLVEGTLDANDIRTLRDAMERCLEIFESEPEQDQERPRADLPPTKRI